MSVTSKHNVVIDIVVVQMLEGTVMVRPISLTKC